MSLARLCIVVGNSFGLITPSYPNLLHCPCPLTKQIGASSLLFAAAHPPGAFVPELLLGVCLGAACVAARGNLVAPTLAHAIYNGVIVAAAAATALMGSGGGGWSGGGGG